jgi:O-antigen ligase
MTRTQRTYVVAAAVAAIVTAANASQGSYFSQSWGWVALAFLVPATVLLILDRVDAPGRLRIAFAGLMVALATWTALSTLWSVSAPASIREVERIVVYVAVALAVAVVLRRGDAPGIVAGILAGVTLICGYALATRLLPDRLDTFDDRLSYYRLSAPLGYWNALGLVAAMGIVLVIGVVAHARQRRHAIAAAAVAPVLVIALYFTFSRGAWVALAFAVAATVVLDPRRLAFVMSLMVLVPAALGVAFASRQDALTNENSPPAAAARDGHRLAWVVAALVIASAALAWLTHRVSDAVPADARKRRLVDIGLAGGVVILLVIALVAVGGPGATASKLRDRFDAAPVNGSDLNDRLFSVSGNGRSQAIRVAWDMAAGHEIGGTGAGTYEYIWYERRPSELVVRDAHSLYLETLGELGIVGLLLLSAVLIVPLLGAVRGRRSRFAAPAAGAYLAWVAAATLDWHWEMVGVTTSALLAGSVGLLVAERGRRDTLAPSVRGGLIAATVLLSVAATWSLVGNQALFAGREAVAREDWAAAREDGRRARALLFWSAEPDLVLGDAAAGLGDRAEALRNYRAAVDADPRSWVAWLHVAQVARGAERSAAYRRVRELNPRETGLPGD